MLSAVACAALSAPEAVVRPGQMSETAGHGTLKKLLDAPLRPVPAEETRSQRTATEGGMPMTYWSPRRSLVLAGTLGTLLVATWPVAAQQPAAPLPPGSPLIGRPDTDSAKKLAPV